jgi:hypothetical protein
MEKPWYKRWWAILLFIIIGFNLYNIIITQNNSRTSTPPPTSQNVVERGSDTSRPESIVAPRYTEEQTRSAQNIMINVRTLADVYEEGDHLVVEFRDYLFPNDKNQRLRFVRAIADADCVITGKTRSIFFYGPGNKQIAKADKLNGVYLK